METPAMCLVNDDDFGHRILVLISGVSAESIQVLELWQIMNLIFQDSMRLWY
jgi:hypothetical protein